MTRSNILTAALVLLVTVAGTPALAQQARSGSTPFVIARGPGLGASAGFSVVLVLGDLQAGSSANDVPPAAAKALADLKDFLPYKTYHLLDAEWTMGAERVTSRLRGPDGKEYELQLQAGTAFGGGVSVSRFVLRDVAAGGQAGKQELDQAEALYAQQALMQARVQQAALQLRDKQGDAQLRSEADALQSELNQLKNKGAYLSSGAIIDTSFSMAMGETVVVGTSRLQGDKALIVLLTAVPRSSASTAPAAR